MQVALSRVCSIRLLALSQRCDKEAIGVYSSRRRRVRLFSRTHAVGCQVGDSDGENGLPALLVPTRAEEIEWLLFEYQTVKRSGDAP